MGLRSASQLTPSGLVSTQRSTPTVGQTVSITAAVTDIIHVLDPAGTLATLTVTLPVADHDGQSVVVSSSQVVTALTLNSAAGTVIGALTTIALGGFATYAWLASQTKWFRCA